MFSHTENFTRISFVLFSNSFTISVFTGQPLNWSNSSLYRNEITLSCNFWQQVFQHFRYSSTTYFSRTKNARSPVPVCNGILRWSCWQTSMNNYLPCKFTCSNSRRRVDFSDILGRKVFCRCMFYSRWILEENCITFISLAESVK